MAFILIFSFICLPFLYTMLGDNYPYIRKQLVVIVQIFRIFIKKKFAISLHENRTEW